MSASISRASNESSTAAAAPVSFSGCVGLSASLERALAGSSPASAGSLVLATAALRFARSVLAAAASSCARLCAARFAAA